MKQSGAGKSFFRLHLKITVISDIYIHWCQTANLKV